MIQRAIVAFTAGAEQADDMTLLVVEVSGVRQLKDHSRAVAAQ